MTEPVETMLKENSLTNVNTSAYRVLYLLLMLVQQRSLNLPELNRTLYDNPHIGRAYNSETLAKYINTLRALGCEIPRSSSKNGYHYALSRHPFPLQLAIGELSLAGKIGELLTRQPDDQLTLRYAQFMEKLEWACDYPASKSKDNKKQAKTAAGNVTDMLEIQKRLLLRYRTYCREKQMLQITYRPSGDAVKTVMMEPGRVVREGRRLFLLGIETDCKTQVKMDLARIETCTQLPVKTRCPYGETTVIFQLYGRLARGYRLYTGEEILFRQEETIQIKARTDNVDALLARLRKYGTLCQVISPQSLRKTMGRQIAQMQRVLENPPKAGGEKRLKALSDRPEMQRFSTK